MSASPRRAVKTMTLVQRPDGSFWIGCIEDALHEGMQIETFGEAEAAARYVRNVLQQWQESRS